MENTIQEPTGRLRNRNTPMNFTWTHNTNNNHSHRRVDGHYLLHLTAA